VPAIDALLRIAGGGAVGAAASAIGAAATPGLKAAASNARVVDAYVRALAATEAARAGAPVVWNSRDQAIAYRDRIAEPLGDAADRASDMGWAASWRALGELRAAWVSHVTSTAAPLPRIAAVTPAAGTSSMLLAYQLDGDALDTLFGRADDIAWRNQVSHPGFLPAGAPLEVLADG
jgi:prophage DNA circulation protein